IREQPDFVRAQIAKLNTTAPIDDLLAADSERRTLLAETENLKAERNRVSKQISTLKDQAQRDPLIAAMKQVGDRIAALDARIREVDARLQALQLEIPNLPHDSVPIGPDEGHNVIHDPVGDIRQFDFTPLPHWELGPALGIMDFERGIKIHGARGYVLKGLGARLERSLISWFLDLHTSEHGFTEVLPPYLVKEECAFGSAHLPKFRDTMYYDAEDNLFLVPTAEMPVTNLHRDEILNLDELPLKYVAYTPCFRREKAAAGRDTRGLKRVHQFDKVEMYKFTTPETSYAELTTLVDAACEVAKRLEIPYRLNEMCTGDLGFAATKKFDIEMWAPGSNEWLEVSSCSNCEAFQARRANVRFRRKPGGATEFVHTFNGSGLAVGRTMIAIIENYQRKDGSIEVPEVLQAYMRTDVIK
ncbi:MAG: serine--tRNA ligase, partial [Chloroflexota bacterium]